MPYLVVEYIPGRNLSQHLKSQPLDPAKALELVRQLAEGLAAVRASGLLHRDLKPANILIADDGRPRLVDFGLAAVQASDDLGRLAGTLAYMAPEQARGEVERIDARTDVFGLGAVLYQLLTGRPPYQGESPQALQEAARAGDVVPARAHTPRLAAAVNRLCMRCLAKDPAARSTSAAELAQAIRRWQRRRALVPWLAGSAAALLVLAAVAWFGPSWFGPHRDESNPAANVPTDPVPRHPDGRELRRDFALKVEMLNGRRDPRQDSYSLKVGQLISFRLESDRDCHVGIWNVTAD
jgi:serine/threonine protein kinase